MFEFEFQTKVVGKTEAHIFRWITFLFSEIMPFMR